MNKETYVCSARKIFLQTSAGTCMCDDSTAAHVFSTSRVRLRICAWSSSERRTAVSVFFDVATVVWCSSWHLVRHTQYGSSQRQLATQAGILHVHVAHAPNDATHGGRSARRSRRPVRPSAHCALFQETALGLVRLFQRTVQSLVLESKCLDGLVVLELAEKLRAR